MSVILFLSTFESTWDSQITKKMTSIVRVVCIFVNPTSDPHLISHNNISTLSTMQELKIKKIVKVPGDYFFSRYSGRQGGKTTAHALRKTRSLQIQNGGRQIVFCHVIGVQFAPAHWSTRCDCPSTFQFNNFGFRVVFLNDNRMFFSKCFLYHCTVFDDSCSRR